MARQRWISGETQRFAEPRRHTWLWKHPGLRSRQSWATKRWTLILRFPNSHLRTLRGYTPNARPRQCGDPQTKSTGSIRIAFVASAANHMVPNKLFVCTLNWSTCNYVKEAPRRFDRAIAPGKGRDPARSLNIININKSLLIYINIMPRTGEITHLR